MNDSFVENYGNLSDEEVVSAFQRGEHDCLQEMIRRYLPVVRHLASGFAPSGETDDLVQEGLMALCTAIERYRGDQAAFSTFAGLCIRRAMLTAKKQAGRKRRIPDELLSSLDDAAEIPDINSPEKLFFEKESLRDLTDSIRLELSDLEYNVLLSFLSGSSYAAIARQLGVTVKSVDNSLMRIRKKLKEKE